jgi:hypothetical protein
VAKTLGLTIGPAPEAQKAPEKVSSNTHKKEAGKSVDLNFKVSAEFRREFKTWAVSHDISQKETLEKAFALLKQHSI